VKHYPFPKTSVTEPLSGRSAEEAESLSKHSFDISATFYGQPLEEEAIALIHTAINSQLQRALEGECTKWELQQQLEDEGIMFDDKGRAEPCCEAHAGAVFAAQSSDGGQFSKSQAIKFIGGIDAGHWVTYGDVAAAAGKRSAAQSITGLLTEQFQLAEATDPSDRGKQQLAHLNCIHRVISSKGVINGSWLPATQTSKPRCELIELSVDITEGEHDPEDSKRDIYSGSLIIQSSLAPSEQWWRADVMDNILDHAKQARDSLTAGDNYRKENEAGELITVGDIEAEGDKCSARITITRS
jgi:alkylated DNA nucleotide flippase Atl1